MQILWLSSEESELPADDAWLSAFERERAGRMRFAKRRNDYLLGRHVTKLAVARVLDLPREAESLRRIEVRNAEDGAPGVWLADAAAAIDISITDRAGWGVCIATLGGAAVGCDLELVEPRSELFVADYFTERERARVDAAPDAEARDALANLTWSAKESALKVLRTGLRRDTRSVEVHLGGEEAEGWQRLHVEVDEGHTFPGWWRRFGDFVLTVCAEAPSEPPAALVEPPALATARPSHAWLDDPIAGLHTSQRTTRRG